MIRYHGGPITPNKAAIAAWRDGHACVSFAWPDQIQIAFEYAADVLIDNGAFSFWGTGKTLDVAAYVEFVDFWRHHPAFGWCLVPDVIDGDERENDALVEEWPLSKFISTPVWHMHESFERLKRLIAEWPRVAIGSSGDFAEIGTKQWEIRIGQAMDICCDAEGYPRTKLHGLRQMDNAITSCLPYASVDSCNIARNIGIDSSWRGPYAPKSKDLRAMVLRDRIASHASCSRWTGCWGRNLELFG